MAQNVQNDKHPQQKMRLCILYPRKCIQLISFNTIVALAHIRSGNEFNEKSQYHKQSPKYSGLEFHNFTQYSYIFVISKSTTASHFRPRA